MTDTQPQTISMSLITAAQRVDVASKAYFEADPATRSIDVAVEFGQALDALRHIAGRASDDTPSPQHISVGAIVPPHCSGSVLGFEPGALHVNKDGSGYITVKEDDFVLEDDRTEGPDGPEGSVHWIVRLDASEMVALRDFLNGAPASAERMAVTEAMVNAADSVLSRRRPGIPDETIRLAIAAALDVAYPSPSKRDRST